MTDLLTTINPATLAALVFVSVWLVSVAVLGGLLELWRWARG